MEQLLERVNGFVWGVPALVLILGVGLYLTVGSGFAQIKLLPQAVRHFFGSMKRGASSERSSFQSLCTALAATVGTGNIAGVAGAIAIGGPGSIFWMWICAVLGMVTKFAEAALSVRYRKVQDGSFLGGPMYMIEEGMGRKWRPLAVIYCLFGVIAAFGVGNATQINAVIGSVNAAVASFGSADTMPGNLIIGGVLAAVTAVCLLGGGQRIGQVAVYLIPFASAAYILLSLGAIAHNAQRIPEAFSAILRGAFCPSAVTGGSVGSAVIALRVGASRGVFTNEAGMGTAGIAHGAADVKSPCQQGLMGIMEVFLDTLVICTMTALVILTSGMPVHYSVDEGVLLTARAFACTYGDGVSIPMALFLSCFAFGTMLGWGLYGLRCAQYLFGKRSQKAFVAVQCAASLASVLLGTGTVWILAETVNGLMAIPNLLALAVLSPEFFKILRQYQNEERPEALFKNQLSPSGNNAANGQDTMLPSDS